MITGTISLVTGGSITLTDDNVLANSVSISMSTCREKKFDFGTFNAALLNIGIIDNDALEHEFAGAEITLSTTFIDENDDEETFNLGHYWVDGTTIKRNRNTVTMTAQDASAQFNKEIASSVRETQYTPATLYAAACTACGVSFDSNVDVTAFINDTVTFTLKSEAIQTWRDAVMWAAMIQACNALINRDGELTLRRAKHQSTSADWIITAADRADIKFSDTRTYPKYMDAYSGGKVKTYTSTATISDPQSQAGKIIMPYNPLLEEKTEQDCDTINAAILAFMDNFLQRQVEARLFTDPRIALGEVVRFTGGKVDVRRSILGIVTSVTWRYHGYTTVVCTAPEAITEES